MESLSDLKGRADSTVWLAVGVVGAALFLLGIYTPALARFPDSLLLEVVFALAGGAVAVLGFSFFYDQREAERSGHGIARPLAGHARELSIAPSFEVYRPETVRRLPVPGEAADEDDAENDPNA